MRAAESEVMYAEDFVRLSAPAQSNRHLKRTMTKAPWDGP